LRHARDTIEQVLVVVGRNIAPVSPSMYAA